MNKKVFVLLPLILMCVLALGFSRIANAQTGTSTRPRTADVGGQPTPTPTATTPAVKPTPNGDDDENQVLKIDTELVNLNVRVVDRENHPINDVKQNEFKIFEDGVPQQIEFFSRSEIPTNYSLVLDNSGSLRSQLEKVIEAGKIIVNTNRKDDETSIIRFVSRDKITVEQPFTANKTDLMDTLDNLYIEGGQTAIIDAVYLAVQQVSDYEKSKSAADRKRRAIILVTDGEDRDSFYTEPQLFDLLKESDVQIYVVGFVGELSKEGGFISKSPQGKAKAFLERMATDTGGKAYFPNSVSELPDIARNIGSELRTQFSIGYLPTNAKPDGTYRNIKVMIDDGPNKQKRIPITKAGRVADAPGAKPTAQAPKTKAQ
jgi:Ca-activated chloride channel family protein